MVDLALLWGGVRWDRRRRARRLVTGTLATAGATARGHALVSFDPGIRHPRIHPATNAGAATDPTLSLTVQQIGRHPSKVSRSYEMRGTDRAGGPTCPFYEWRLQPCAGLYE